MKEEEVRYPESAIKKIVAEAERRGEERGRVNGAKEIVRLIERKRPFTMSGNAECMLCAHLMGEVWKQFDRQQFEVNLENKQASHE